MIPESLNEEADGGLPPRTGYPSSLTPETDAVDINQKARSWEASYWNMREHARKLERERNEEMGYRGQWCDKARKAEAALDDMEELTRELGATKKTLGTLIVWLAVELGEENVKRLLDMMSPEND